MKIEPIQTERIQITGKEQNPEWDTGVRLPILDISEYSTGWGISAGFFEIVLKADGKLYIDGVEYIKTVTV
jgi:hypothetical protein